MRFCEIHPFVRFSRYMAVENPMEYPEFIPLDSRLFYTISGEGQIRTEKEVYTMTHGSILIIPAGKNYHILTPKEKVEYLVLNFDYTSRASVRSLPEHPHPAHMPDCPPLIDAVSFSDAECLNGILYSECMTGIENKLIKLEFEYSGRLLYSENKTSALLTEVLTECVREQEFKHSFPDGGHNRISDIISYIHQNYMQDISNMTLAEKFHFHPNYISGLIKHYTGLPLHRYLLRVRITNAVNLLETTNLSIGEIAAEVGFYDCSYFTRYFKQIIGKTPNKFRNGK